MAPKITQTDLPFPAFSLEADCDYLLARHLAFTGGIFHSRAGYFSHQACENVLQAPTAPVGAISLGANCCFQTHRRLFQRLFGTKLRASRSPLIFGVGIPDIGSTDSDAGRFKGATAVGRAVPKRCLDPIQISPLNKESGPCRCCSGYQ